MLDAVLHPEPPPLTDVRAELPVALTQVVEKALQDARAVVAAYDVDDDEALRLTEHPATPFGLIWRPTWAAVASRWDLEQEIETVPLSNLQGFLKAGRLAATGHFFATRGCFEKAIENYREAAATAVFREGEGLGTGAPATAIISLAALLSLKDSEGALAEMERALALQPASPRGHYFSGWFALWLGGDIAKAEQHLERLAKLKWQRPPADPLARCITTRF